MFFCSVFYCQFTMFCHDFYEKSRQNRIPFFLYSAPEFLIRRLLTFNPSGVSNIVYKNDQDFDIHHSLIPELLCSTLLTLNFLL